jgi:hypothetical protein
MGVQRFEINGSFRKPLAFFHSGQERDSMQVWGLIDVEDITDSGKDIHMGDILFDPPLIDSRRSDDQRHREGAVVGEVAMSALSVLPQGLTMVSGEDDQSVFV